MVKLLLQTAHLLQHATGVAGRHLFGDLVVARQQGLGLGDAVFDVAEHGLALIQRRLLLQDAHRVTGHQPRFAVGRLLQPGHHPQQRRLSGSVRADHADLRPGQERQRDLVQDDVAVKSLAGVAEDQDLLHVPTPLPSRLPGRDVGTGAVVAGPSAIAQATRHQDAHGLLITENGARRGLARTTAVCRWRSLLITHGAYTGADAAMTTRVPPWRRRPGWAQPCPCRPRG